MPQRPVTIETAGWHVSLHACGDRIAHTIGLITTHGRVVPLLASIEGTDDDDWPPSPPLTTIETSQQGGVQQVMLLGMAGRSHWSASIQLDEIARRIQFDVACRVKDAPQRLGSSYRSMLSGCARGGGSELRVDGQTVRVEAAQPAAVVVTPEGLNVPVDPPQGDFPQTVCWSYAICRLP